MDKVRTVALLPTFRPESIGGVAVHVAALQRHLAILGWQFAPAERADIVHCHAMEQYSRVDVYTNHGIYPLRDAMPAWQQRANQAIFDNLKLAQQVIAVSEWTASQWSHLVGRHPHIIPNGIDLTDWQNVPRGRWRAKLQLSSHKILAVWGKTSFSDVCDPTPAIELALRRPDVTVVMPVDPKALIQPPHNLKLVGLQPFAAMQALLADADIYLATTCENHSIQVLEALALGTPILAYDWGGTGETLRDGGGVLVQSGDLAALVEGVDVVLDQRAELTKSGKELVAERYQWSRIVKQLVEVYEMAHGERKPRARGPVCSVVIPCYNKAGFIGETLQSALRQAHAPAYEIIVVDDGSTDDSLTMIKQTLAGAPVKTQVIEQANAGVANARNTGIKAAKGRYICCLDADDLLDPLFLSRTAAALDADPGLGITYSDFVVFGHQHDGQPLAPSLIQCAEYDFERLKQGNFLPCCNLFRKTAWERAGGYKPEIDKYGPSWEDYELWLNMGKLGWYGRRVPGGLFHYRKVTKTGRDYASQGRAHILRAAVNRLHRDLYPPLVSFVIPCYGQSKFLKEAIDSALGQTFPDLEVVVVDDGNAADEATAIREIVAEYGGDVRLVGLPENSKLATARNAGIGAAVGQWFVPLDADDKVAPEFLERALTAIGMNPRLFAYPDSTLWFPDEPEKNKVLTAEEYDFTTMLQRITWPCTILASKQAWEAAGGYKPQMSTAGGWEDWEFAVTLGELGICGVRIAHGPLFFYRQHSDSQMHRTAGDNKPQLRETMRRIHAETYNGGRPVGCCGSARKIRNDAKEEAPRPAQSTTRNAGVPVTSDTVLVRYVGAAIGAQNWRAPSGRIYRFGLSTPLQQVNRSDIAWFTRRPDFQEVTV